MNQVYLVWASPPDEMGRFFCPLVYVFDNYKEASIYAKEHGFHLGSPYMVKSSAADAEAADRKMQIITALSKLNSADRALLQEAGILNEREL